MKKCIVIGCPGSGKTTFAEKLHTATGLPLFYLDAIWHLPDRTHISRADFDAKLREILAGDAWLIDGNYSRTLEVRMAACDTVFLFDLPVADCLAGATARLGQKRSDMPWIDTALDPFLKAEIEDFPQTVLPQINRLLAQYGKQAIVFHSHAEADAYLAAR